MAVAVFGSINMDLVVRVARLPAAGETLAGQAFFTAPGGKGANQAVACARLGAVTHMVGAVGDDVFGASLRAALADAGVDTAGVAVRAGQPSGVAVIAVDDRAENSIVIVPGANGAIGEADLARLDRALATARVLLLQLEIPLDVVVAAAKAARQRDCLVILDPAPARELPPELYGLIDLLTPNETEAAALVGFAVRDQADAARAASVLLTRGSRGVIVKLGARGALLADTSGRSFCPAFSVDAVDTVAAGDAFNGALAVALAEGRSLAEAVRWGAAAGALAATRAGAQPSMPDRPALLSLLERGT